MRIAILGAGVIGVTTAYELISRDNAHQIAVYDVASEVATEASAVNASMIAPGHAYAWASPKVPMILLKSFYRHDQAFRIRFQLNRQFWKWTALFLKQCNNHDAKENSLRKHTLCTYSQKVLNEVVDRHQIEYDQITRGVLYLFRNQNSLKSGISHSKLLVSNGHHFEILDPQQIAELDPAYSSAKTSIAGAIYSPSDESGSCAKFTKALTNLCEQKGVQFNYDHKIINLKVENGSILSAASSKGEIEADLYVVSLGAHSPIVLRTAGVDLPICPVKGYSVTLPTSKTNIPPTIGSVDEDNLVACAPMGESVRATATAEFAGYNLTHRPKDFRHIIKAVSDLMPDAAKFDNPTYRTCLRPMTPQGTPYIGFTKVENLFVNSGHGHMGWTMACGSARIAADLIHGRPTGIDADAFSPIV